MTSVCRIGKSACERAPQEGDSTPTVQRRRAMRLSADSLKLANERIEQKKGAQSESTENKVKNTWICAKCVIV